MTPQKLFNHLMPRGNVWQRTQVLTFHTRLGVLQNNIIACFGDVQIFMFAIERPGTGCVVNGITVVYRKKKKPAGLAQMPTIPKHVGAKAKERHDDSLLCCRASNYHNFVGDQSLRIHQSFGSSHEGWVVVDVRPLGRNYESWGQMRRLHDTVNK